MNYCARCGTKIATAWFKTESDMVSYKDPFERYLYDECNGNLILVDPTGIKADRTVRCANNLRDQYEALIPLTK